MDPLPPLPHTCRICHESATEDRGQLAHPCKCTGTMKYVHPTCLHEWIAASGVQNCGICKHEFKFAITYGPSLPTTYWQITRALLKIALTTYYKIFRVTTLMCVSTLAFAFVHSIAYERTIYSHPGQLFAHALTAAFVHFNMSYLLRIAYISLLRNRNLSIDRWLDKYILKPRIEILVEPHRYYIWKQYRDLFWIRAYTHTISQISACHVMTGSSAQLRQLEARACLLLNMHALPSQPDPLGRIIVWQTKEELQFDLADLIHRDTQRILVHAEEWSPHVRDLWFNINLRPPSEAETSVLIKWVQWFDKHLTFDWIPQSFYITGERTPPTEHLSQFVQPGLPIARPIKDLSIDEMSGWDLKVPFWSLPKVIAINIWHTAWTCWAFFIPYWVGRLIVDHNIDPNDDWKFVFALFQRECLYIGYIGWLATLTVLLCVAGIVQHHITRSDVSQHYRALSRLGTMTLVLSKLAFCAFLEFFAVPCMMGTTVQLLLTPLYKPIMFDAISFGKQLWDQVQIPPLNLVPAYLVAGVLFLSSVIRLFVLVKRTLRRGAVWFIRDLESEFDWTQEVLTRSFFRRLLRVLEGITIYVAILITTMGIPAICMAYLNVLPLHVIAEGETLEGWHFLTSISLALLLVVVPRRSSIFTYMEYALVKCLTKLAPALRLSSYMFGVFLPQEMLPVDPGLHWTNNEDFKQDLTRGKDLIMQSVDLDANLDPDAIREINQMSCRIIWKPSWFKCRCLVYVVSCMMGISFTGSVLITVSLLIGRLICICIDIQLNDMLNIAMGAFTLMALRDTNARMILKVALALVVFRLTSIRITNPHIWDYLKPVLKWAWDHSHFTVIPSAIITFVMFVKIVAETWTAHVMEEHVIDRRLENL